MQHTSLSDEALVSQIASLCLEGRRLVARLIVHLIEVEDRALDKKSACSSMWAFCTERLHMSEGETSRRLNAAKLVRRFPSVLGRLERGEIVIRMPDGRKGKPAPGAMERALRGLSRSSLLMG